MPDRGLNPKQTRFVAEYLIDLNATQAYIRAGYSPGGASQAAEKLLRNAEVQAAVAKGQAKVAGKLEITAEKVLADLEELRLLALSDKAYGPAAKAIELHGKHIGMFVDRTENNTKLTVHDAIDRPPQETREQWIARRQRDLNAALGTTVGTAD